MEFGSQSRQLILALYVLTGVLTKEQLEIMILEGRPVPDSWQEIIEEIESIRGK